MNSVGRVLARGAVVGRHVAQLLFEIRRRGRPFISALMLQLWFGQAVFAYFRSGWVSIGPGGLGKDAPAVARASLAAVAFFIYLLGFFLAFGR